MFSGFGVDSVSGRNEQRIFVPTPQLIDKLSVYGDQTYVALEDIETIQMLGELAGSRDYHLKGNIRMAVNGGIREMMSDEGNRIMLQGGGVIPWQVLGTVHIGLLEMYWVEPGRALEPVDILKEALEFAVKFAECPNKWVHPSNKTGLEAYDLWIRLVESENPSIFGLSYSSQCWAECRKHAAAFLREAAEKIGGSIAVLLTDAATVYQVIYEHLQHAADLLPFEGKCDDHYRKPERFTQISYHLKQAKRAEEAGLGQLTNILKAMEKQRTL